MKKGKEVEGKKEKRKKVRRVQESRNKEITQKLKQASSHGK